MLAISFPGFVRNQLSTIICEEANSAAYYSLILLISNLAGSVMSPIVGKLGDLYGRKRLSLFMLVPFAFSLILCGIAAGPVVLAISYALIGICYSGLDSAVSGMIIDAFDKETSTRLLGFSSSFNTVAGILGPILVGLLADNVGAQRAVMLITILVVIAWLLILFCYPDIRNIKQDTVIDVKGVILLPLTTAPFCIAFAIGGEQLPWTSPIIWMMFAASIIFGFLFYRVEGNVSQPIVNFKMFSNKAVLAGILFMFLWRSVTSLLLYFNLYCREVLGFNATELGSLQIFMWLNAIAAPVIMYYLSKTKHYKLILAISAAFSVMAPFAFLMLKPGTSVFMACVLRIPQILIAGFAMAPLNAYFGEVMDAKQRGIALSLIGFSTATGTSVFNAIYAAVLNATPGGIADAFSTMCYIAVAIGIIRLLTVLLQIRDPK